MSRQLNTRIPPTELKAVLQIIWNQFSAPVCVPFWDTKAVLPLAHVQDLEAEALSVLSQSYQKENGPYISVMLTEAALADALSYYYNSLAETIVLDREVSPAIEYTIGLPVDESGAFGLRLALFYQGPDELFKGKFEQMRKEIRPFRFAVVSLQCWV